MQASMAELDGGPTADKEVAGSTPSRVGNIHVDQRWNIFYLSLPLIQEG